jgi:hypothetical protein
LERLWSKAAGCVRAWISTRQGYLYPNEFSALVANADVPIEWRRTFAVPT